MKINIHRVPSPIYCLQDCRCGSNCAKAGRLLRFFETGIGLPRRKVLRRSTTALAVLPRSLRTCVGIHNLLGLDACHRACKRPMRHFRHLDAFMRRIDIDIPKNTRGSSALFRRVLSRLADGRHRRPGRFCCRLTSVVPRYADTASGF